LFVAYVIALVYTFNGLLNNLQSHNHSLLADPAALFDSGKFTAKGNRFRRGFLGLLILGLVFNLVVFYVSQRQVAG
jgi:hypothetical protein